MIAAAAAPVITRLYTPDEFAVLGVYMSLLGIIAVPAMLRYESAIPGCTDEGKATALFFLSQIIAVVISLLSVAVIILFKSLISTGLKIDKLLPYIWIVPIGVFLSSTYLLLVNWSIRNQNFRSIAKTKITQSVGMVLFQIILGACKIGPVGLLLGHVVGQSGGIRTLLKPYIQHFKDNIRIVTQKNLRAVFVEFNRFPKYSVPASLLESLSTNAPILIMAAIYSPEVAGWMTLLQRTIYIPVSLLSGSISQVNFGEIAANKIVDPANIKKTFSKRLTQLVCIGVVLIPAVVVIGYFIIPVVFGQQWSNASLCLLFLSPMLFGSFISTPFGCVLDVLHRQDLHLLRDGLRFALISAVLAFIYFANIEWSFALLLLSAVGMLCSIIYVVISWFAIKTYVASELVGGAKVS